MTIRQKEILTAVCGFATVLGLWLWADRLAETVKQGKLFDALRLSQAQSEFRVQLDNAYYIQEGTGIRMARPGSQFFGVQFNSLGFRGPELPEELDDKTVRIAYMGSSITLDKRATPDEKSWPALVTEKLAKAYLGCKFVYQNTGITGMSTRQLVAYYKEILSRFQPDITVVMTDDRIVTLHQLAQRTGLKNGPADAFSFTREQLLGQYEQELPKLLQLIRQHGSVPVLLGFGQRLQEGQSPEDQAVIARGGAAHMPYMTRENFLQSARWYNDAMKTIANAEQVTFIEWHTRVPGIGPYFFDFRHFSPTGSARVADVIADELQKSEIFTEAMAGRFGCH